MNVIVSGKILHARSNLKVVWNNSVRDPSIKS